MPRARCLFVLFLVLGLVLGTGFTNAAGFAADDMAPGMTMKMPMTGSLVPAMCDTCIKGALASHTCSNFCLGVQAILPSVSSSPPTMRVRLLPVDEHDVDRADAPPDPPPPKLNLLA